MAVVVVVVVLVVAAIAGVLLARRGAARAARRIESTLEGLEVLRRTKANFYGVASEGKGQTRGLGTLALTRDELIFVQFVPDRVIRVPRSRIVGATLARSFLGKTQSRELLVVSWDNEAAAWDVPDVASWERDLHR